VPPAVSRPAPIAPPPTPSTPSTPVVTPRVQVAPPSNNNPVATPRPQPGNRPPAPATNVVSADDSPSRRSRIIQPISSPTDQPNIQDLVNKEMAREQENVPTPAPTSTDATAGVAASTVPVSTAEEKNVVQQQLNDFMNTPAPAPPAAPTPSTLPPFNPMDESEPEAAPASAQSPQPQIGFPQAPAAPTAQPQAGVSNGPQPPQAPTA
jgi:hypothetical protein